MSIPGSNIALLRRQMGLSQTAFAEAVKMDLGNLSKLESGKVGYSRELIERIAKALSVSVGVLFAEPDVVEAAALRMRQVPLLTPDQLLHWRRPGQVELTDEQVYLHAALRAVSAHSFALQVQDEANAPVLAPGDELVFDAAVHPHIGQYVAAQDEDGTVYLGRFRKMVQMGANAPFEVVPLNHFYAAVSSSAVPGLRLRGTLVERRTRFI